MDGALSWRRRTGDVAAVPISWTNDWIVMLKISKTSFDNEIVVLDGKSFEECSFSNCEIVFRGGLTQLTGNKFDHCKWSFGGVAGNTLTFMKALYHGGGKEIVESTFDDIREGSDLGAEK